jgi:hypothetical protein
MCYYILDRDIYFKCLIELVLKFADFNNRYIMGITSAQFECHRYWPVCSLFMGVLVKLNILVVVTS